MKIVSAPLPVSQYYQGVFTKRNIVLHHTVSSTAKSALTWWAIDPGRIGTAYVIDKDGTIYEAFKPEYWAHHLGLKSSNNIALNKCSIGIEIVNEGPLKLVDGRGYRWNFSAANPNGSPYLDQIVSPSNPWKGFNLWASYTEAQYQALNELLPMLLQQFNLKPTICPDNQFDPKAPFKYTIYTHSNVRLDKTDVSPAFDFQRLTCLKPAVPV